MPERPGASDDLGGRTARRTRRKLRARRHRDRSTWLGLGMYGLVGWSVVMPTRLGVAAGVWIDGRWPSQFSWRLMLLFAGVCYPAALAPAEGPGHTSSCPSCDLGSRGAVRYWTATISRYEPSFNMAAPVEAVMPCVLVFNCGSSSIRFAVDEAGDTLRRRLDGTIDRIGVSDATLSSTTPT